MRGGQRPTRQAKVERPDAGFVVVSGGAFVAPADADPLHCVERVSRAAREGPVALEKDDQMRPRHDVGNGTRRSRVVERFAHWAARGYRSGACLAMRQSGLPLRGWAL